MILALLLAAYADLTKLFADWREFQRPKVIQGVPDYSKAAMDAQRGQLPQLVSRLQAIDPKGWPIPRQVDWQLVQAEMNGLDFDHRVLRPWERNPAFYVTVYADESDQPAREGPFAWGGFDLWKYSFPLQAADEQLLRQHLALIPPLLAQARQNLTGDGHDLWVFGAKSLREQADALAAIDAKVSGDTQAAERKAKEATLQLAQWVEQQAPNKKAPSGVGIENYDWYLAHVQLMPNTWATEKALCEREMARAKAMLALEEVKNRSLPPQQPIDSEPEWKARHAAAISEYMKFLAEKQIKPMRDYLEPALRTHVAQYSARRPLEFFAEVDSRDPEVLLTHSYHYFDLARMKYEPNPSPIRKGPLLYNIFDNRTEGFATANEELEMHLGMLDSRPRSRELIWILLAQRGARALASLYAQANQMTLEEAAKFATSHTPRGWLRMENQTVWFEQHLYLQQPAYGPSYVMGKIQFDELLAARAEQLGSQFTMTKFFDEFDAAGLIPMPLIRWELTGVSPWTGQR